jgi:hypothetical protein
MFSIAARIPASLPLTGDLAAATADSSSASAARATSNSSKISAAARKRWARNSRSPKNPLVVRIARGECDAERGKWDALVLQAGGKCVAQHI